MPFDAQPQPASTPEAKLDAKCAEINAAFRGAMGAGDYLTGVRSFAGVADSVRLANEHRLRGER